MLNIEKANLSAMEKTLIKELNTVEANLNLSSDHQDKILSVDGFVCSGEIAFENGAINFSGKVYFNVIFSGEEPERIETGVRFDFKKTVDFDICSAAVSYNLEDFSVKSDGGMLFVTANLVSELTLYRETSYEYVSAVNCLSKTGEVEYAKTCFVKGRLEENDKFDAVRIKKVLLSKANTACFSTKTEKNTVIVEGSTVIYLVLLPFSENSDIVKETRTIPFRYELEADGADENCLAAVKASIGKLSVKVYNGEGENKSTIESEFTVDFCGFYRSIEKSPCVVDAVSNDCELNFTKTDYSYDMLTAQKCVTERVSGRAAVNVPEYSRFIKAVGERVVLSDVSVYDGELSVAGVVEADCVFSGDNGSVSAKSQLPFKVLCELSGDYADNVTVYAEALQGRLRSGKLEQDITLRITFCEYSKCTATCVSEVQEGMQKPAYRPVITVYMGACGDTEWDVTKATGEDINKIYEYNPDLTFPLKGDEKILILRSKP